MAVEEDARQLRVHVRTHRWSGEVTLALVGRFQCPQRPGRDRPWRGAGAGAGGYSDRPGRCSGCSRTHGAGGLRSAVRLIRRLRPLARSLQTVLDQLAPLATAGGGLIAVFGSAGGAGCPEAADDGPLAGQRCRPGRRHRRRIHAAKIAGRFSMTSRPAQRPRASVAATDLLCIPDRRDAIARCLRAGRAR